MNIADTVTAAAAVAAAVVAAIAIYYGRKDAHASAEAAKESQRETERQVKISQRIANVADQTFGSSSRPIIVSDAIPDTLFKYSEQALDERNSWSGGDFAAYVQFPIRNVGVGPAMIASVKMTIVADEYDKTRETCNGYSNITAMAPSETGLLAYRAMLIEEGASELIRSLERGETLTAEISYTDIGARRRYLTRFVLMPRTRGTSKDPRGITRDFTLATTEIYECDEQGNTKGPPIASSKLQDPDGSPQD